jgi:DUF971 family protein
MKPKNIAADRAKAVLTVDWHGDESSVIPFNVLSDLCPCELCDNERRDTNPLKILRARSYELEAINPIGSYAINIMWKGGCHYGIYSWEYLHKLGIAASRMSAKPADAS